MNLPSVWNGFLSSFEKQNSSPVLIPILNKTSLLEINNGQAFVLCENSGMRFFLDTRREVLSAAFSSWMGQKTEIVFFVKNSALQQKKPVANMPLLTTISNKELILKKSGLQKKFAFENFAVSNSNQIAYSAAQAVSENPGSTYNPLFIYGTVGVGKTHLVHAIANKVLETDENKRVLFCSSEEFTNDLIESIRSKTTAGVRKKYRHLDILIIDDVQFIAGKNYVQEEFYHTFNSIIKKGGQIILTSDKPPREIKRLEDRLRSRFSGGLTIDIQKPDFELRTAILLIKAKERNIDIELGVAKTIAEHIQDVRELEGKLLELYTRTLKTNGVVAIASIKEELFKREAENHQKIHPNDVIKTVATYYDISPSQLKSPSRKEKVAFPRQVVMYVLRKSLHMKYEEIGFILKKKDHTTIIYGVDKIADILLKDPTFKESFDRIITSLYQQI